MYFLKVNDVFQRDLALGKPQSQIRRLLVLPGEAVVVEPPKNAEHLHDGFPVVGAVAIPCPPGTTRTGNRSLQDGPPPNLHEEVIDPVHAGLIVKPVQVVFVVVAIDGQVSNRFLEFAHILERMNEPRYRRGMGMPGKRFSRLAACAGSIRIGSRSCRRAFRGRCPRLLKSAALGISSSAA